jgi:hypothetical protein
LWQHDTGTLAYWMMDHANRIGAGHFSPGHVDPIWRVMGPK